MRYKLRAVDKEGHVVDPIYQRTGRFYRHQGQRRIPKKLIEPIYWRTQTGGIIGDPIILLSSSSSSSTTDSG